MRRRFVNMKKTIVLITVLLLFCFAAGCARKPAQPVLDESFAATAVPTAEPTAVPTPEPTPAPTEEPPIEVTAVEGTVISVGDTDILVQLDDGSTFNFLIAEDEGTIAVKGDKVTVYYEGDLTDNPIAQVISVTKVYPVMTIDGTVLQHDANTLFVEISSSDVLGFVLTKDTIVTGLAEEIMAGDQVTVTYEGDLLDGPPAVQVEITELATETRMDDISDESNVMNKHMSGRVIKVSSNKFTIQANKTKTYTFKRTADTEYQLGDYSLKTGLRVRVEYDGFASKNPDAKRVSLITIEDPTPTSAPRMTATVSGLVKSFGGMWLALDNGYEFDVTYASYAGEGSRVPGDYANVTYYLGTDGILYATKVIFTPVIPIN